MSQANFDIKLQEHFKLHISVKNKIIFESKLLHYGIKYHLDGNEQMSVDTGLKYYFLDSDSEKINQILIKNGIVSSTESNIIGDFKEHSKIITLAVIITLIIIVVFILIAIVGNLFH